ncbi:hypothetical protein [Piscirickettsia salmonis]|nr:hypothetical protein [Piscirickettsia salmonis]
MQDVITQPMHATANTTNNTAIDTMPHAKQLPSAAMGAVAA